MNKRLTNETKTINLLWTLCRCRALLADLPSRRWYRSRRFWHVQCWDVVWPEKRTCASHTRGNKSHDSSADHQVNCKWLPPLVQLLNETAQQTHHEAKTRHKKWKVKKKILFNEPIEWMEKTNLERRCVCAFLRKRSQVRSKLRWEFFRGDWKNKRIEWENKERKQ